MPQKALSWPDRKLILLALEATGGNQLATTRYLADRGTPFSTGSVSNVATDFRKLRDSLMAVSGVDPEDPLLRSEAVRQLRKEKGLLLSTLAKRLHVTVPQAHAIVGNLEESGYILHRRGDRVRIGRVSAYRQSDFVERSPLDGNTRRFGVLSDTHLASKHERLDVLHAAYDRYAELGITEVYHCGNLVEGEAPFNQYELLAHGCTDQALYCVANYPQRSGMTTHFITGLCHEGWWMKREGLDFGRYLMGELRMVGREDMNYLGFSEVDIALVNAEGESTMMRLFHPGGGTAYALSYATQKIVECVPLDSEILTDWGWRKWNEVAVGDRVLGYNAETERCEWTSVEAINRGRGPVVEYKNDNFKVRCTPNHRWAMTQEARGGPNPRSRCPRQYSVSKMAWGTIDAARNNWRRCRLLQAAPAPDGAGWEPEKHAEWLNRGASPQNVLQMTAAQRRAFIHGMMLGEGTEIQKSGTLVFSQRPGPVLDAFALACFLEGIAPGLTRSTSTKMDGTEKVCGRMTMLRKPWRMVDSLRPQGEPVEEEVWCPTTTLGSWVMRQGDTITITGNSLQGGEKPSVLFVGHFHKAMYHMVRNVHTIQAGCVQDQTRWMRNRKIDAHVGYWTIELEQDKVGAVRRVRPEFTAFYDRKYHLGHTHRG